MAPSQDSLPTRLVICVDGSQYSPSSGGIETNIHRIYASIQVGKVTDSSNGGVFKQEVKYVPGIGSADDAFSRDRIQASVLGQGHLKQIQDVYESCSQLNSERDEIWLFGFSRGAFVARAVAGLLHNFGAVASAGQPEFSRDFKKVLKDAERLSGSTSLSLSPTTSVSSARTKYAARIQFVGCFETIRGVSDEALFDISFNRSIRNMRHAVAIHEDRKALTPEYLYPDELYGTALKDYDRSFIQAHFIGAHNDMGGAAKKFGLALYPLQWMLLEAKRCGLVVDLHGGPDDPSNPLHVVFPKPKKKKHDKKDKKDKKNAEPDQLFSFTTGNGIEVQFQDLREVHGLSRDNEKSYAIKLNSSKLGSIRQKKAREPFTQAGYLNGYCDWAPQGTIIHPSVYLLLDEHVNVSLETKEIKLQRHIEDWREKMLGPQDSGANTGFWLDADDEDDPSNPGAIRVLVCGNTGVGKSTLINKTFGVDVTQSSHRTRGIHDVREEITWEGRPDLIVHDSGGFEAGTDDEFKAIEAFLQDKSAAENVLDRVHVIWFCIDINSPRTLQTATEKLYLAVSQYAKEVPIIVVATKKDDFLDIEFGKYRKMMKSKGEKPNEEAGEQYAEEQLQERIETIRAEMETVPGGRLDGCLAVSQDDDESISNLSKTTSHCFDTDKVRLLYIRAQVSRIDLKIDLALAEILKRYKKMIRRTGTNFGLFGATITQKVTVHLLTKAIINCFGLPTVSSDLALEALKANVWKTLGANIQLAFAELFALFGLTGTVFAAGIPVWLITGSINASHIVPTTCRLFLIMACDLTLVLARSFREVTFRARGQPTEKDVGAAARNYAVRGYAHNVHKDIKDLIPRKQPLAAFKVETVQRGVEDLFARYKDNLMQDVDLPMEIQGIKIGSDSDLSRTTSTADADLMDDLKEASAAIAELEAEGSAAGQDSKGTAVAELDGAAPLVELPAEREISEMDGVSTVRPTANPAANPGAKHAELPASPISISSPVGTLQTLPDYSTTASSTWQRDDRKDEPVGTMQTLPEYQSPTSPTWQRGDRKDDPPPPSYEP